VNVVLSVCYELLIKYFKLLRLNQRKYKISIGNSVGYIIPISTVKTQILKLKLSSYLGRLKRRMKVIILNYNEELYEYTLFTS